MTKTPATKDPAPKNPGDTRPRRQMPQVTKVPGITIFILTLYSFRIRLEYSRYVDADK